MAEPEDSGATGSDLQDWEQSLTINVGAAFVCRACGNVVMVIRGGVGVMELLCCGRPMEAIAARKGAGGR